EVSVIFQLPGHFLLLGLSTAAPHGSTPSLARSSGSGVAQLDERGHCQVICHVVPPRIARGRERLRAAKPWPEVTGKVQIAPLHQASVPFLPGRDRTVEPVAMSARFTLCILSRDFADTRLPRRTQERVAPMTTARHRPETEALLTPS